MTKYLNVKKYIPYKVEALEEDAVSISKAKR